MKYKMNTVAVCLILCATAVLLCACGGNGLKLPNGDYVACDKNGVILEETRYFTAFTVNGKKVSLSLTPTQTFAGADLSSFNDLNGEIKKDKYDGWCFAFSYKVTDEWFHTTMTKYLNFCLTYDKTSGIVKVKDPFRPEYYYFIKKP